MWVVCFLNYCNTFMILFFVRPPTVICSRDLSLTFCNILLYKRYIRNYWRGISFLVSMFSGIYTKINKVLSNKKCFTVLWLYIVGFSAIFQDVQILNYYVFIIILLWSRNILQQIWSKLIEPLPRYRNSKFRNICHFSDKNMRILLHSCM